MIFSSMYVGVQIVLWEVPVAKTLEVEAWP